MRSEEELNPGFRLGEWEVFPLRGILRSGDEEKKPEPRVFGVLMELAKRDGDLVTRDELIDALWDGRPTGDEPINRCVSQVRDHLGDKTRPYKYVETLTRRGYRLIQPIELLQAAEPEPTPAPSPRTSRWKFVAAMAIAAFVTWMLIDGPDGDPDCIVVLPFENASGDPANDYLVSGFQDEMVQTLYKIPGFRVKTTRDQEIAENAYDDIARDFGCDVTLTGRVHRVGDILQVFFVLQDALTGDVIATGEIDGRVDGIFEHQEQLARMVRDELQGKSSQQLITRTRPANFAAYDRYMRGLYAFDKRQDSAESLEQAIEFFQETIRRDERFGPAYVMLATAYALMPTYRDVPPRELNRAAITTAEQGIAVDESIRDAANVVFGFAYHKEMDWLRSEKAYKAATSANIVDPNAFNWYSRMLASVGRLEESLQQAKIAVEMDPTSAVFNSRVAMAHLWLGDTDNAGVSFERAEQYGASGTTHMMGYALYLYQQGMIEEAYEVSRRAAMVGGGSLDWIAPVFAALQDPARQPEALDAINAAAASDGVSEQVEFIVRTVIGDIDGAIGVARELETHGEIFEMDLLFIPQVQPVREHPEFLELLESLGVTRYWYENGCVWSPTRVDCGAA